MTDGDTLRMLADAADGFAAFDAARIRAWRDQPPGFDRERWREMAAQGWFGILADEDLGGLGLDLDAAVVVARALGKACAPEPFVAAGVMAPVLLAECARISDRRDTLDAVVNGEQIACPAWQDAGGALTPERPAVRAAATASGFQLTGEARFAAVAHADAFIVLAEGDNAAGLYWVPSGSTNLIARPEAQADGGASGWLTFNDVAIDREAQLVNGDAAKAIVAEAIDVSVIANCAELVGMIERSLELTLDYLKTRKQFGRPIGAFQVLQHRAVDLWMQKEIATHAMNAAVRKLVSPDLPAGARARAASGAKARVGEVALKIANETVQLHGAIGFTDEYDLGLYVNRILARVPFLGNASEHRTRYGELRQTLGNTPV